METKTILPATTVFTVTSNSPDFGFGEKNDARGCMIFLNLSAVSGTTPTLVMKLQAKDTLTGNYIDIPGATTTSLTTVGETVLTLHPVVTAAANQAIAQAMPNTMRAVFTIGGTTPSFTLSLFAQALV